MLEKMSDFFEARLDGYDAHMLDCIASARVFYPFTASLLPTGAESRVLDLGCGTGLELEYYYQNAPRARVTGIDLCAPMLAELRRKLGNQPIELICGSYFDIPLGKEQFDAAVSVESLHHFTQPEKLTLYKRLYDALKADGYFILTDYFAQTEEQESLYRAELLAQKKEQGIDDDAFYHYDTPLTVAHETEALLAAGFSSVTVLGNWESTYTLKAQK